MRGVVDDAGAVAVIVALMMIVFISMAAITIDVGALYWERRQLQNGADAAALAVAEDCSNGKDLSACGDYKATAESFADVNAEDDASNVDDTAGVIIDYPAHKVTVLADTVDPTSADPSRLSHWFAGIWGVDSSPVQAKSVAIWGPIKAGSYDTLPIALSLCEYEKYATAAYGYPATEEWSSGRNGPPVNIFIHGDQEPCNSSPSGLDLPGGFAWLDNTGGCEADIIDGYMGVDTGINVPKVCDPVYLQQNVLGKVIELPVFQEDNGLTGSNAAYEYAFYAAFYVAGYHLDNKASDAVIDPSTGSKFSTCSGSDRCLVGWFTHGSTLEGEVDLSAPDTGAYTVQLTLD